VILGRLLQIAVVLGLLSFASYALIGLMPGDPIDLAIAGDPRLGPEDAARMRALHGLDRPLIARYGTWATGVLQGEFGYSRCLRRVCCGRREAPRWCCSAAR
jgi:peptide/nickel transport system permease protein